ncbi:MAG TPA: PilX N-terminal domain-containing pilus assembly protein [Nevskia sp.]|nr:PilX N-terminal domain-containing pilus assembly protein [Nevskia sp.]
MKSRPHRQGGFTLIVGLILLVLMTLVAMVAFNMGKGSLQVVDNMEQRNQAQAAAQYALDQAISLLAFSDTPGSVFAANKNCPSGVTPGANSECVDVNGDGKIIMQVSMSPQPACISSSPVSLAQLDLTSAEDQTCVIGGGGGTSLGKISQGSSCYNTVWELNAAASELTSEAQVLVTEGVGLRKQSDVVATYCP